MKTKLIIVFCLILLLVGGYFLLKKSSNEQTIQEAYTIFCSRSSLETNIEVHKISERVDRIDDKISQFYRNLPDELDGK